MTDKTIHVTMTQGEAILVIREIASSIIHTIDRLTQLSPIPSKFDFKYLCKYTDRAKAITDALKEKIGD